MKYSPLTDIDRSNVGSLAPAWEWEPGESRIDATDSTLAASPGNFQATPIMIGDTLYLSTPFNEVVALDAESGNELWRFDPETYRYGQPSNGTGYVHRGVATWTDGAQRRIFIASRWRLIALDAATGQPVESFGESGEVDLTATLRRPVNRLHYTNTSPPVVWGDLVIVGNGVGDRLTYRDDPPGDVQAFDARSGEFVWRFNTVPGPGEFGQDSWGGDSWDHVGHTNVWAPFSVDVERGLVYLPVSTPSNDWYGGARPGDNLFAESIVCVDAATGERVWHFQAVHHGLWDYDPPAPPVLFSVEHNGTSIDAVALLGKTGFAYVFDRVTGDPLWPIEERPVPRSDIPGEQASPTQPFPTLPEPFTHQGFSADDVVDFTPEIRQAALEAIEGLRLGPIFTPPSLEGTLTLPGVIGGAGWGGGAYDPVAQVLYVKGSNLPAVMRLVEGEESDTVQARYVYRGGGVRVRMPAPADGPAGDAGGRGGRGQAGGRGGRGGLNLPINKPPYGNMTAIDMRTGRHLWQVPLGDDPDIREHPMLAHLDLPRLGVAGAPGPIVTAGGLLFATGGGDVLYALDAGDGSVLWEAPLGASGYAVPMTYRTSAGRQFVVIATGRGGSAVLKAFAIGP